MNKIYQKPFPGAKNAGFTLIELLVVVLIIGILSSVALPQYTKAVEKARATEAITLVKQMDNAFTLWNLAQGSQYTPGFVPAPFNELDIELPCILSADGNSCESKNFKYTHGGGCGHITAIRKGPHPYTIWTGSGCAHPAGRLFCYPGGDGGSQESAQALAVCTSLNMLEPSDAYYSPW